MPSISVILATARPSYPLLNDPRWHIFGGPAECLRAQTFTDFEWIVVDLDFDRRRGWFEANPQPFPVKHVPIKKNPWTPRGKRAASASRNTGVLHATGELLVFFDDAWTLDPTWLQRHWDWYKRGYFGASLYRRAEAPGAALSAWKDGREAFLVDGLRLRGEGDPLGMPPTYGGISVSAEAMARVGGYEELLDAGWGLEDIELGYRLHAADYKFVLDRDLFITFHPNHGLIPAFNPPGQEATLCCENLVRRKLDRIQRGDHLANVAPWTEEERAWFVPRCHYLRKDGDCDVYGKGHLCSRPYAQAPNPEDADVREALFALPRGLRR